MSLQHKAVQQSLEVCVCVGGGESVFPMVYFCSAVLCYNAETVGVALALYYSVLIHMQSGCVLFDDDVSAGQSPPLPCLTDSPV